jgi:hypothetical protein
MTDTPLTELLDQHDPLADEPGADPEVDDFDDGFDDAAPGRRLPRATYALLAALLVAAGFAGGILVQKHAAPATMATGVPSFAGGLPTGGFPAGGGSGQAPNLGAAAGTGTGSSSTSDSPAVIGTVVSVDGATVIVEDLGGKQHKVTTTASTAVSQTTTLAASQLKAGQSVVVNGTKKSDGTVTATSVTAR